MRQCRHLSSDHASGIVRHGGLVLSNLRAGTQFRMGFGGSGGGGAGGLPERLDLPEFGQGFNGGFGLLFGEGGKELFRRSR